MMATLASEAVLWAYQSVCCRERLHAPSMKKRAVMGSHHRQRVMRSWERQLPAHAKVIFKHTRWRLKRSFHPTKRTHHTQLTDVMQLT